jgi:hypothetical protein
MVHSLSGICVIFALVEACHVSATVNRILAAVDVEVRSPMERYTIRDRLARFIDPTTAVRPEWLERITVVGEKMKRVSGVRTRCHDRTSNRNGASNEQASLFVLAPHFHGLLSLPRDGVGGDTEVGLVTAAPSSNTTLRTMESGSPVSTDLILTMGQISTLDPTMPLGNRCGDREKPFFDVGDYREMMTHRGSETRVIDLGRRRVVPGLNDSHVHVTGGGLYFSKELRWDGVPSLSMMLPMLKA